MNCVTAEIQVKLRRPALIDEPLIITSSVTKKTRKIVETKANISLRDGTQIAEGTGTQFVIKARLGEASDKKAVIWDMDGVIVDTAQYHLKGWQIVFQKRGANYTEEDFRRNTGMRSDSIIRRVLGEETAQGEIMKIIREKDETFRQLMGQNIRPFPGVLNLITSLKEHGFKIAIASSAPMENIQLITQGLKIHNYFDAIISGWEVTKGKPDPQTFLLAAEKLGIEAKNCIVIEDAISGVTASKRARMLCIAVTNTTPREELRRADLIIDTLEEITIDDIERLLHQHK
jgi:beta-phosphoglucomutase family hydrolase